MTYNEQETIRNDIQQHEKTYNKQETTYNEQETTSQRARYNLKRHELTYNEEKRSKTTSNKQILRLFYTMGQSVSLL